MSAPKEAERRAAEAEEEALDEAADSDSSIESLVARADVDGLLDLAKAYRVGADGHARDLAACFRCYDEAAKLGSVQAEYSAALFHLSGGIVEKDPKLAATRLRTAADGGFTPAKVYLANLYELGIHYKADPEKADVWYRNAARSSEIKDDPDTPEFARAMAEIGCVRYCLDFAHDESLSEEDRAHFLKKAKAFGYRDPDGPEGRQSPIPPSVLDGTASLRIAPIATASVATGESENTAPAPQAKPTAKAAPSPDADAKETKPAAKPKKPSLPLDWSLGMYAFLYAVVFVAGSIAGGHALHEGARLLLESGRPIPLLGTRLELVRPLVFAVVGILPMGIVYRLDTLGRALLVSGLAAVIGEGLWFSGKEILPIHATQVIGFAAAGLLGALLVLGIAGGTRSSKRPRIRRR